MPGTGGRAIVVAVGSRNVLLPWVTATMPRNNGITATPHPCSATIAALSSELSDGSAASMHCSFVMSSPKIGRAIASDSGLRPERLRGGHSRHRHRGVGTGAVGWTTVGTGAVGTGNVGRHRRDRHRRDGRGGHRRGRRVGPVGIVVLATSRPGSGWSACAGDAGPERLPRSRQHNRPERPSFDASAHRNATRSQCPRRAQAIVDLGVSRRSPTRRGTASTCAPTPRARARRCTPRDGSR